MDKDTVKRYNDFCVRNKAYFCDLIEVADAKLREPEDPGDVSFAVSLLEYTALWGEKEAMEKLAGHFSNIGETERAQHYEKAARTRGEHKCQCCGKPIDPDPRGTLKDLPFSRVLFSNDHAVLWAQVRGCCSSECMEKNGVVMPDISFKEFMKDSFDGSCNYGREMSECCNPWYLKTMRKCIWCIIVAVAAILLLIIWGLVALIFY